MSYVKKTWASGDTITSAALNNIENQVATNEPFRIPFTLTFVDEAPVVTTTVAFAAAKAAKLAGQSLIALASMEGLEFTLPLAATSNPEDPSDFLFSAAINMNGADETPEPTLYRIDFSANNATFEMLPLTPASA